MKDRPLPTVRPDTDAEPRRRVLIVGEASFARRHTVSAFIARGYATMICDGPPPCTLLDGTRCALVNAADATVFMPTNIPCRGVLKGLDACARASKNPIVVEPSVLRQLPLGGSVVESADTTRIVRRVQATIESATPAG